MPPGRSSGSQPDDEFGVEEEWGDRPHSDDEYDSDDPAFAGHDDDESETVPCPACSAAVYENADYCPACGAAIVPEGRGPGRKAWIVAVVLMVALLAGAFLYL